MAYESSFIIPEYESNQCVVFWQSRRKCIFIHMICMAKPYNKNPCPGVIKFTNLVNPSLVINTIYLATSREEDFKRNISILIFFFTVNNFFFWRWGVIYFTISYLLTLKMLHTEFCQVFVEKKMLMHGWIRHK